MANHVRNVLQFSGKQEDIDRLLKHIGGDDSEFDFNILIPMPRTLDIENGSRTTLGFEAAQYLATGVIAKGAFLTNWHRQEAPSLTLEQFIDTLVKSCRCDLNLGEVARDNIRDHGYPTWYEWCCANWGTKWNAYYVVDGVNKLTFDTAWSAPEPVIDKLAELFPAVQITHYWADEDVGNNCGHTVYSEGGKETIFIIDQSREAYEIYVHCWGETECLDHDESGDWTRKDCELCVGCD